MRHRKPYGNNSPANIKLPKSQFHKIGQSEGFLGRFLIPVIKTGLSLIGSIPKWLAKSVLIPLGSTAVASATDAAIHKKMFGSGMHLSKDLTKVININNFKWRNE